MDKQKVLSKIKKCLALAKSSNEHEAAQALKQAQALMRDFELTEHDVDCAQVNEQHKPFTYRPSPWQALLVQMCGKAFGCRYYIDKAWCFKIHQSKSRVHFVGLGERSELASYAFDVLSRQLRAARSEYKNTALKRVRVQKNLMYRLDEFSLGWVQGVNHLITSFAGTVQEQETLDLYMRQKYPNLKSKAPTAKNATAQIKEQAERDFYNGLNEGESAQLYQAVQGARQQPLQSLCNMN
ncbi:hypothetical protein ADP71_14900 [Vitreoscilla sp. C1]|uniref:DUF2786 domain-containing protein n=1 Tax=Vitreoscilla sp. (strain C1) TaxID=96942 RepID=UPI000CDCBBDB|nr:DUF2786 domain-containing protein [Vitreoscilla sp. C1]AUZ05086.1 hypothetical protein ADP71_14900 [Vitreoscilla sp. C1]